MESRSTLTRLRNAEKESAVVPHEKQELCHRNILAGGRLAGENYLKYSFPRKSVEDKCSPWKGNTVSF